jgi:hypothetical protein
MYRLMLAAAAILVACFAAPAHAGCEAIPDMVRDYLHANPEWSLLTDMHDDDDQKSWDRLHPGLCPGIAEGNFYGSGSKTYAVVLTRAVGSKTNEKIVLVRRVGARLSEQVLIPAYEMHIPMVVIAMPPGTYEDAWKSRKVILDHDSILTAQWEAAADLYYFRRGKFRRLEYEI